jgi:RNA polymerase sigma factor (sigma-70 family)
MADEAGPGASSANRAALILRHRGLVYRMAERLPCPPDWRPELEQQGYLGLIKAVDGFDPSRGLAFSTYAVPVILGEMRHWLRSAWRERRRQVEWPDGGTGAETALDPDPVVDRLSLAEAFSRLEPDDATLIRLYFYHEWSQARLAGVLGVSQSAVSRRLRQALLQLRQELTGASQ